MLLFGTGESTRLQDNTHLDQQQIKELMEFFSKQYISNMLVCECCYAKKWELIEHPMVNHFLVNEEKYTGHKDIPHYLVVGCTNCGNSKMFNGITIFKKMQEERK